MKSSSFGGCVMKSVLVLTNLIFIAIGAFTVYFGVQLKKNDGLWQESDVMVTGYDGAEVRTLATWLSIGFGIFIILIALSGCFGALRRGRGLLCCYNIFVVLAVIIFAALFVCSAMIYFQNKDKNYPISAYEEQVAEKFNVRYCAANLDLVCDKVPAEKSLAIIHPQGPQELIDMTTPNDTLSHAIKTKHATFGQICHDDKLKKFSRVESICKVCGQNVELKSNDDVQKLMAKKCPSTITTFGFCAKANWKSYEKSPYQHCRPVIMSYWNHSMKWFTIGTGVFSGYALLILIFSCCLMKSRNSHYDSSDEEKSPLVNNRL